MNTSTCHPRLPDRQNDDIFLSNNMEKISRKERLRKSSGEKVVGYEMTGKHELARSWGLELRRLFIQGLEVFFVEIIVREYLEGLFSKRRALHEGRTICFEHRKWRWQLRFIDRIENRKTFFLTLADFAGLELCRQCMIRGRRCPPSGATSSRRTPEVHASVASRGS